MSRRYIATEEIETDPHQIRKSAAIVAIFGLIFFFIGLNAFHTSSIYNKQCSEEVMGTIIDCNEYIEKSHKTGSHTSTTTHKYRVTVSYEVDGQIYETDSSGYTKYQLNKKFPDSRVTIHYNPADPDQSYIENDNITVSMFGYVICMIIGGLLIVLAIAVVTGKMQMYHVESRY